MKLKVKNLIRDVLKKHDVKKAGIFGSYARGEEKKNSDIDILVEIKEGLSLIDIINIKINLEEILNKKVDLVEYGTIKSIIRKQILEEEIKII